MATLEEQIAEARKRLEAIEGQVASRAGNQYLIEPAYQAAYKRIQSPELDRRIAETSGQMYSAPAEARSRYQNLYNPFDIERLAAGSQSQLEQKLAALRNLKQQREGTALDAGKNALARYQAETSRIGTAGDIAQRGYERLTDQEQRQYTRGRETEADRLTRQKFELDKYKEGLPTSYQDLGEQTQGGLSEFMKALAKHESGGDYNAKGAAGEIGKYQILPGNWNAWGAEYLQSVGKPGQTFAPTPENQEAIAQFKIGQLYSKYKNWEDVAAAWNSGSPRTNSAGQYVNSKGVPNVQKYVDSVMGNFGTIPTTSKIDYGDQEQRKLETKFGAEWKTKSSRQQQLDYLYGEDQVTKAVESIQKGLLTSGIPEEVAKGILLDLQQGMTPTEIEQSLIDSGWPKEYFKRTVDLLNQSPLLSSGIGTKFIPRGE